MTMRIINPDGSISTVEDLDSLCAVIGYEWFWEPRTITPPPVFCEPTWYDSEWPPNELMPKRAFMADEIRVCRVHDEYWPCAAVRAGRPVTFPPAQVQSVLVCRPKEELHVAPPGFAAVEEGARTDG